jgi:hypothetical protein
MLYLISGASRSGKTIIAHNILKQQQIPYVSLDWLVMGFTNGIPEYGIHDRLLPNEIAERLWSFLKAMCESMLWLEGDYVIEGEAVLPHLVRELAEAYPDQVRICFLGYTDVDPGRKTGDIKAYSDGTDDWLVKEHDDHIRDHVKVMMAHSRKIKEGCAEYGMRYVDTSTDFTAAVAEATTYLLGFE